MSEKFSKIKELVESGIEIQMCLDTISGDKWVDIKEPKSLITFYKKSTKWYDKQKFRISGEKTLI